MEREKKREYMERLTRELLAYDSEAVGEAVKCRAQTRTSSKPPRLRLTTRYYSLRH